jgi:chorismate--pyruvate lyase
MEGSMTRELLKLAPQAQLQVLADEPCEAYPDEAQITGPAARLERREICFCLPCGTPLMAARTLYDLRGGPAGQSVGALGNRPLGALLFADGRSASWSLREIACVSPPHPLAGLTAGIGLTGTLWARRSRYWLGAEPLLVTEIFLPALQALLRAAVQDPALSYSPLASSDMP